MPPPTERLEVWMNGLHVATWSVSAGVHRLQYDPDWIANPDGRALSLSLAFVPGNVPHRGEVVENYFDNLLPDSVDIRKRLQIKFGCRTAATFDLLSAIGRDCAGAVQLLPSDTTPEAPSKPNRSMLPAWSDSWPRRFRPTARSAALQMNFEFPLRGYKRRPPYSGTTSAGTAPPAPRRPRIF